MLQSFAANFAPNRLDYSQDDTIEYMKKCDQRDTDLSNVLCSLTSEWNAEDDRPVFIYPTDFTEMLLLHFLIPLQTAADKCLLP